MAKFLLCIEDAAYFPLATVISKHLESICIRYHSISPREITVDCARLLQMGLKKLDMTTTLIYDDFLEALASSGASKSLLEFTCTSAPLTDASSASWKAFPQLQRLNINSSPYITVVSLREMAKLPLEVFQFELPKPSLEECIGILASLPAIRKFDIKFFKRNFHRDFPMMKAMLQDWPARRTISKIRFSGSVPALPDNQSVLSFHEFFPNLKLLSAVGNWDRYPMDPRAIPSCFSNLRLFSFNDSVSIPQGTLESLATSLPALRHLVLWFPTDSDETVTLSSFTSLQMLSVEPFRVTEYPATLRELHLGMQPFAMRTLTPQKLDELIDAICLLSSLERLVTSQLQLSEDNFRKILTSFPRLSSLTCATESQLPISHPRIASAPYSPYANQSLKLGYLPRISTLADPHLELLLDEATIGLLPSLQEIVFQKEVYPVPFKRFPLLRSVCTPSITPSLLKDLAAAKHIRDFKVDGILQDFNNIVVILDALPFLASLDLNGVRDVPPPGFKSRSLRVLSLSVAPHSDEDATPPALVGLTMSGSQTPLLESFRIMNVRQLDVRLRDLEHLSTVLVGSGPGSCDVAFSARRCRRLQEIRLLGDAGQACLKRLDLADLISLKKLEISLSYRRLNMAHVSIAVPSLERAEISAAQNGRDQAELTAAMQSAVVVGCGDHVLFESAEHGGECVIQ